MSKKRDTTGRTVIDFLMGEYMRGRSFPNTPAIRAVLIQELSLKPAKVGLGQAANWDRQARYELARVERVSVTGPGNTNQGLRDPNASPKARYDSRLQERQSINTRLKHQALLAAVDAEQPDATKREIEVVVVLETMEMLMGRLNRAEAEAEAEGV